MKETLDLNLPPNIPRISEGQWTFVSGTICHWIAQLNTFPKMPQEIVCFNLFQHNDNFATPTPKIENIEKRFFFRSSYKLDWF